MNGFKKGWKMNSSRKILVASLLTLTLLTVALPTASASEGVFAPARSRCSDMGIKLTLAKLGWEVQGNDKATKVEIRKIRKKAKDKDTRRMLDELINSVDFGQYDVELHRDVYTRLKRGYC